MGIGVERLLSLTDNHKNIRDKTIRFDIITEGLEAEKKIVGINSVA